MNKKPSNRSNGEDLAPSKAAPLVVDQARMLLPGIQALFGFQLIAVFNQTFAEKLTPIEQRIHLLAIALIVLTTMILIMPAAYHRQMEVQDVTEEFIHLASRLILISMVPFAISISMEFYLISRIILNDPSLALGFSIVMIVLFFALWFGLPRLEAFRRLLGQKP